jgi:hypothetical protein
MSIYVLLRNDGAIGVLTSEHDGATKEVEKYAKAFDFQIKRLLLWMADLQGEDIHFERNVSDLVVQPIKDKHSEWVQAYKKKERQFAAVNPHLQSDEAKQMFADISMGFVPSGSSTKGPST